MSLLKRRVFGVWIVLRRRWSDEVWGWESGAHWMSLATKMASWNVKRPEVMRVDWIWFHCFRFWWFFERDAIALRRETKTCI